MDYDISSGKIKYPDDIKKSLEKLSMMLQGMPSNTIIADSELETSDIVASDM